MSFIATAILAYLLGSIPFGIVMARLFGLGDLRQIGSGNIGATNVLRTGNKLAAFLTLLGDSGKGALAVVIARILVGEQAAGIAGLCAMLGHLYPVFLRFKGGKGVATFLGTLLALSFPAGVLACGTWLLVAVITRYSSLSALIAALMAPIYTAFFYHLHGALLVLMLTALIFYKHRENIMRLKAGTETKIGKKG
ncbi:glycerol-3-phosphate 1-O-acyltransferase PlsY [Celeribacter persicus]|uniref:Glycerol-3-phosphate acyltransferase n=1 Tax=Celeribacter persicus TaxID=1651082 RepID=A0A2T5HPH1_9RHOB|nr:glycerol-3-phosphate 1-O-acyltransferase PlsY [Celeribacter persicus]PTQ73481.1 acyl-phosphate glycerol-3-phosphate acyltransferase [Celeribacter persicus]